MDEEVSAKNDVGSSSGCSTPSVPLQKGEKFKDLIQGVGAAVVFVILVGLVYQRCFAHETVANSVVTGMGEYEVEMETGYYETQVRIDVDNHDRCFRGHRPFGTNLKVGDRLEYIIYRPGLVGPCDLVVESRLK
jgi:hypothetical protein